MTRLAAFAALARPGNALMAGAGAAVGAIGAAGLDAAPISTVVAALSAVAGVAGANALNDARDAAIDRTAHPERPIPSGAVSVGAASAMGWGLILAALALAAVPNAWTGALALLLAATLIAYEFGAKRLFLGHVLVSYAAGSLFLLGGLAALTPPLTYDRTTLAGMVGDSALVGPLVMAILAMLLNLSRELFKSIEDAAHDAPTRRTFAVRHGAPRTRALALVLIALLVPVALAPWWWGFFDAVYLVALVPMLSLLCAVPFIDSARTTQRLLKLAMLVGFVPFAATALI